MRTFLLAAALLATALVPTTAADAGNPVKDAVDCLFGTYFPETSIYQIVYGCTLGDVHPEPIEHFTGCEPSSPPNLSGCVVAFRLPDADHPCDWFASITC